MSGSAARSKVEARSVAAFLMGGLAGPELRVTYAIAYAAKGARRGRRRAWPESLRERRSGQW
ncbi:hypothetical protein AAFX91_27115 [Bradyrhizobium sp. 31Argb]|uniref:hypothetical protein n=1 Tax=unclassified Bradyrhizobium TaxID=2631580 RepID=UPI00102E7BE2|nr:hypothetical protein [Bradyrhizobium sp. Leo170]TAI62428.1 hypothetical protein CWO89_29810 [Bradyrhizobium sp. Leo170]